MCVLQNLALSTCITSIFCTCSLYYFIIILLCTCMYECVDYSSLRLVFTVFSSTIKKVSSSSSSTRLHLSKSQSNRTRTRLLCQSNRTHDSFHDYFKKKCFSDILIANTKQPEFRIIRLC